MKVVQRRIEDLEPAIYNPRKISKEAMAQLKKSLEIFEAVEPVVINVKDGKNTIVGGHQRLKAAKELGWETFPCVEVELNEKQEKELNVRLNANVGEWDTEKLNEWFELQELADWGLDVDMLIDDGQEDDDTYTRKIEAPIYEPQMDTPPPLSELVDRKKRDELVKQIDKAKIPEDVKEFLRVAADRHMKFDYSLIAEYYSHATPEIQDLMEKSALVIIDVDKAIEYGYTQLPAEFAKLYRETYD